MDELFLPDSNTDSSVDTTTQLPNDMSQWPEFIIEKLRDQFDIPDTIGVRFNIKNSEESERTAVGSITLTPSQMEDKSVIFPIIIERGLLHPLDIYYFDGEYRPATRDNLQMLFSEQFQYAQTNEPNTPEQSRISSTNPIDIPITYKVASESLLKSFGIEDAKLQKVSHVIEKFAAYFSADSVSSGRRIGPEAQQDINSTEVDDADIVQIRKVDLPDHYEVTFTTGHVMPAKTRIANGPTVRNIILNFIPSTEEAKRLLSDLDSRGYITLANRPEIGKLLTDESERLSPAVMACTGRVISSDQMIYSGYCFPAMTDIYGHPVPGLTLFVNGSGEYSLGNILYCKQDGSINIDAVPGKVPGAGQRGVFLFDVDGSVECTSPFEVKYIATIGGSIMVGADFLLGGSTVFKTDPYVKRVLTIDNQDGKMTIIPAGSKFLALRKPIITLETMIPLDQGAMDTLNMTKVALHKDSVGYTIETGGEQISTMAKKADAEFTLHVMGVPPLLIKRAFERVDSEDKAELMGHYFINKPDGFKKIASIKKGKLIIPKCNWVKVAEELDNAESVDAILSLQYYTPQYLQKMIEKADLFEKARNYLAKMVLYARLTKAMDANVLRDALFSIDQVCTQIDGLRSE